VKTLSVGAVLAWITFCVTLVAGWLTHIIVCIQQQEWLLLIAGAILAPIGTIHGIGHWFGAWGGR
jgi:hypothetical protein